MTRETKVGLVVACSFLCLVGIVVASKWRRGDDGTNGTEQQEIKVAAVKEGQPSLPTPELPKQNEIRPLDKGVAPLPVNVIPSNTPDPVAANLREAMKPQPVAPPSSPFPPLPEDNSKPKPFNAEAIPPLPPAVAPFEVTTPPLPKPKEPPPVIPPPEAVRPAGGTEIAQAPLPKPIDPLPALPMSKDPAPVVGGAPLPGLPKDPLPVTKDPLPVLPMPKDPLPGLPGLPMPKDPLPVAKDPLPGLPMPKDPLPVAKDPFPGLPAPKDPLPAIPVQPKDPAPAFAPKEPPLPILKNPAPSNDPAPVLQPQPIPTIPRDSAPSVPPIAVNGGRPSMPVVKETTLDFHECQRGEDTFANLSMRFYGTDRYADALETYNRANSKMIPNGSNLTLSHPVLTPGQKVLQPPKDLLEREYPQNIRPVAAIPAPVNPAPAPAVKLTQPMPLTPMPSAVAPTPVAAGVYKVQNPNGESILDIAERSLGNRSRWTAIYDLNRTNPAVQPQFRIPAGTELKMPAN